MTRAPFVMAKPEAPSRAASAALRHDPRLALRQPALAERYPLESMGETGENVAERWGVAREDQDAFALRSQQRWAAAAEAGRFDASCVPPPGERGARRASAPETTLESSPGCGRRSARAAR